MVTEGATLGSLFLSHRKLSPKLNGVFNVLCVVMSLLLISEGMGMYVPDTVGQINCNVCSAELHIVNQVCEERWMVRHVS